MAMRFELRFRLWSTQFSVCELVMFTMADAWCQRSVFAHFARCMRCPSTTLQRCCSKVLYSSLLLRAPTASWMGTLERHWSRRATRQRAACTHGRAYKQRQVTMQCQAPMPPVLAFPRYFQYLKFNSVCSGAEDGDPQLQTCSSLNEVD